MASRHAGQEPAHVSLPPNNLTDDLDARRRRGVRRTVFLVGGIALLIYIGFVTGLIGR